MQNCNTLKVMLQKMVHKGKTFIYSRLKLSYQIDEVGIFYYIFVSVSIVARMSEPLIFFLERDSLSGGFSCLLLDIGQ